MMVSGGLPLMMAGAALLATLAFVRLPALRFRGLRLLLVDLAFLLADLELIGALPRLGLC